MVFIVAVWSWLKGALNLSTKNYLIVNESFRVSHKICIASDLFWQKDQYIEIIFMQKFQIISIFRIRPISVSFFTGCCEVARLSVEDTGNMKSQIHTQA